MENYESLNPYEKEAVEMALDQMKYQLELVGTVLARDDRSARAAEALATYIVASRD